MTAHRPRNNRSRSLLQLLVPGYRSPMGQNSPAHTKLGRLAFRAAVVTVVAAGLAGMMIGCSSKPQTLQQYRMQQMQQMEEDATYSGGRPNWETAPGSQFYQPDILGDDNFRNNQGPEF